MEVVNGPNVTPGIAVRTGGVIPAYGGRPAPTSPFPDRSTLFLQFPFDYTVGPTGIPVHFDTWTPQSGDMILDAWFQVLTAFDGTTPHTDFGSNMTVYGRGAMSGFNTGAWDLTRPDALAAGFRANGNVNSNTALEYLGQILDEPPGPLAPLMLWVSQSGLYGDSPSGSTVGQAVLRLQVVLADIWQS